MRAATIIRALVLTVALLLPSGVALAHDELLSTTPAHGAALAAAPRTLTLSFGGALAGPGTVTTRGPDGTHAAKAHLDPKDARRMIGPISAAGPGRYTVSWTATASDGDLIGGKVAFRVREPSLSDVVGTIARDLRRTVARIVAAMA
jgi:methionine-rich copper-binding protein CopC